MKNPTKTKKPKTKEPPLSDWQKYEAQKKRLQALGLMPDKYDAEIQAIAEKLEV